jgi:hypothetical protein
MMLIGISRSAPQNEWLRLYWPEYYFVVAVFLDHAIQSLSLLRMLVGCDTVVA